MKVFMSIFVMFTIVSPLVWAKCPISEIEGEYDVVDSTCRESNNGQITIFKDPNPPTFVKVIRTDNASAEVWLDNYGFAYSANSDQRKQYECQNSSSTKMIRSFLANYPNINHVRYDEFSRINHRTTYVSYSITPYNNMGNFYESSCSYHLEKK